MILKVVRKIPEKACPDWYFKSRIIKMIKVCYHVEDIERISFMPDGYITATDYHFTAASRKGKPRSRTQNMISRGVYLPSAHKDSIPWHSRNSSGMVRERTIAVMR